MSKNKTQLNILNPCNQDWNQMTDNNGGKYCKSCEKKVIDFTVFSDEDLKNWFKQNHGKVCGRIRFEQLNISAEQTTIFSFKISSPLVMATSLFAFLNLSTITKSNGKSYLTYKTDNKDFLKIDNEEKCQLEVDTSRKITGKIVDKNDKLPLPGVFIILEGFELKTSTDNQGMFEIYLPENYDKKSASLKISYIGYDPKIVTYNFSKINNLNLELCVSRSILGEVTIVNYKKKGIINKIRHFLRKFNPLPIKDN